MNRSTFFRGRVSVKGLVCGSLLLILMMVSTPVCAQDVSIGRVPNACWITQYYSLPIDLTLNPSHAFGGFDFQIGYASVFLTLNGATQGDLLSICGWEYFTYRINPPTDSLGLVRIVAIADINNGNLHPYCFLQGRSGTLATLNFSVLPSADCMGFSPVRFYWIDCGDNVISSTLGDSLYFAQNVYDSVGAAPFPKPTSLPSWSGVPDTCVNSPGKTSTRLINYVNGGFDFICCDPANNRGDLNLNAIPNEIADMVTYMNYFLYGIGSFFPDPMMRDQQIAASDINADGATLTFRDLVYLYRIIIGDALPFPKPNVDSTSAAFVQDLGYKKVSVSYPGNVAGVLLSFEGIIEPIVLWSPSWIGVQWYPDTLNNMTMVMVFGSDRDSCGCGTILRYKGHGTLVYAEAGDWFDSKIGATISTIGTAHECGDVNGSGMINITDASYSVNYIFGDGPYPIDAHDGDLNCDGVVNVSDIIYLVMYVFAGGPAPCSGC